MDFKATPSSIRDMLDLKRSYIIPRFQREYSWKNEELLELWNDLLDSFSIKDGMLIPQEYFLGSIVLVDNDGNSSTDRQVVDGQQRLMTITIAFSVLAQKFKSIGEAGLSKKMHEYIVGYDANEQPFTRLITETPKPFFQYRIQEKDIDFSQIPKTEEEKNILNAYRFFDEYLSENKFRRELDKENRINEYKNSYVELLKLFRDQILECRVIHVTVDSFDDAYQIFEVLNAKGMDLEPTDLIKNSIFSVLDSTVPVDIAYEKWKSIKKNLSDNNGEEFKSFYRYFWISRYSFVTKKKLVAEFNKRIPRDQESYKRFLTEMEDASNVYSKISNPSRKNWRGVQNRPIYDCLNNLNSFNIKQVRIILLALIEANKKGIVSSKILIKALKDLEYFHFVFNAVCSMRSSSIERLNSRYSRKLLQCLDKEAGNACVREYLVELMRLLPPYTTFEPAFEKLYYTQEHDSDKKLIQYILRTYEGYCSVTNELVVEDFTIEHIMSESTHKEEVGHIGNLLPLGDTLNNKIGDADFCIKINKYKDSSFNSVKTFVIDYSHRKTWTKKDIDNRTKSMAKTMYERKIR